MTFTYSVPFASDLDRMRFHLGDIDSTAPRQSDEELTAVLTLEGVETWQQGVLVAITGMISRLTTPNFKADWLQVDVKSARDGYWQLLEMKRTEFGLSASIVATVKHVSRADLPPRTSDDGTVYEYPGW